MEKSGVRHKDTRGNERARTYLHVTIYAKRIYHSRLSTLLSSRPACLFTIHECIDKRFRARCTAFLPSLAPGSGSLHRLRNALLAGALHFSRRIIPRAEQKGAAECSTGAVVVIQEGERRSYSPLSRLPTPVNSPPNRCVCPRK